MHFIVVGVGYRATAGPAEPLPAGPAAARGRPGPAARDAEDRAHNKATGNWLLSNIFVRPLSPCPPVGGGYPSFVRSSVGAYRSKRSSRKGKYRAISFRQQTTPHTAQHTAAAASIPARRRTVVQADRSNETGTRHFLVNLFSTVCSNSQAPVDIISTTAAHNRDNKHWSR